MAAESIGVAATGGTCRDGSRWVSYDCGEWQAIARSHNDQWGWTVHLRRPCEGAPEVALLPHRMRETVAALVAEAVAAAVGHVLQGVAQGAAMPTVDEEALAAQHDRYIREVEEDLTRRKAEGCAYCSQCGAPFIPTSVDRERCGICGRGAKGF